MKTLVNQIVVSPKFGKGIIREVDVENGRVTIEFEDGQTKNLLVRFSNLTFENGEKVELPEVTVIKESVKKQPKSKRQSKKIVITIDDLKEFRNLIIWNIRFTSYGFDVVKEVMEIMLKDVQDGKIISKSKRGIKGTLTRYSRNLTLELVEKKLRDKLGLDILDDYTSHPEFEKFLIYKLKKIS